MSVDYTDDEQTSSMDNITDETTDTVYSDLANLLTTLQSAHPAGHTLDTCLVSSVLCHRPEPSDGSGRSPIVEPHPLPTLIGRKNSSREDIGLTRLMCAQVMPSGECLRSKGPPDWIVGKTWRRLFLAAYPSLC